jgi:hypothetical protein
MLRFFFQFGAFSMVFLFSALVAWYEGSALLEDPSEWKYSTPFSKLINGMVYEKSDILQWDFFIYAAKYRPTFPIIMLVSGLYLLLLIGYYLFKNLKKWYACYLFFISGGLFLLSYLSYDFSTAGVQKMFFLFTISGSCCLLFGLIIYLKTTIRMRRMKME